MTDNDKAREQFRESLERMSRVLSGVNFSFAKAAERIAESHERLRLALTSNNELTYEEIEKKRNYAFRNKIEAERRLGRLQVKHIVAKARRDLGLPE